MLKKLVFSFTFCFFALLAYSQPRFYSTNLPTRCAGTNQTDSLTGLSNGQDYVVTLMPGNLDTIELLNVTPNQSFTFRIPTPVNQGSNYYFIIARKSALGTTLDTSDRFQIDQRISFTPVLTANPTSICSGQSVAFTMSHNSSPYSYALDFGDGGAVRLNPGLNENKTYTLTTFGGGTISYLATYIVSNGTCPQREDTTTVWVRQRPSSELDVTSSGIDWDATLGIFKNCGATRSNPNFSLTVYNKTPLTTNVSYSINWGTGGWVNLGNTFNAATKNYTSLGYFNISVVSSRNGCTDTSRYRFFNGNTPAGGINNPGSLNGLCGPITIGFPVDTANTNTNPPGTVYTFTVNDSSPSQTFTQATLPNVIFHTFTKSSCGVNSLVGTNTFVNSFQATMFITNPCGDAGNTLAPVRVSTKPVANFSFPDTVICKSETVTLTNLSTSNWINGTTCANTFGSKWIITPGVLNTDYRILAGSLTSPNPTIQFIRAGNYSILLEVSNTTNCPKDTMIKTICVQDTLRPRFTSNASPNTSCAPVRYLLTNITDTSQTCNQKQWRWSVWDSLGTTQILSGTSGVTINNPNNTNGDIQFSSAGKYTIRLSATNDCGTFDTSMTVNIKRPPTLTISPNIAYCGDQTISFQSTNHRFTADNGFGTISQYTWSSDSLAFGSATTTGITNTIALKVVNKCPKEYNLTIQARNECGLSNPVVQKVTIYPPLTPDVISRFQMICKDAPANLITGTNHQYASCRNFTYTWETATSGSGPWTTAPGTSNGVNYNPANISNTPGTYFYRRRVTDGVCSSMTDTMSIVVKPSLANNTITADQSICYGFTPSPLTGSTPTGANGTYTYQWQFSTNGGSTWNNVPSAGTSINYAPGILFSTTSYRRIVQGTPCIGDTFRLISNVVVITVNPLPDGVISFNPNATCSNLPFTATLTPNTPPTVSTYAWSSVGSPAITIQSPNSASTIITPANNQSGSSYSYTLICTLTSAQGCIDTVQKPFTIGPRPTAGFTIPAIACPPISLNITNTATGGSIYFYSVTPSNAAFPATIDTSISKVTPRIIFPNNTTGGNLTYTILQRVFNATGCFDTISRFITVFPRPNARISSADSICAAGVLNISHNGATPPAITAYQWIITSNTTPAATIAAPTSASTTITFPDQQGGSNQTLVLRQIVTTADGCKDTTNKSITMLPRPTANLTRSDSAICAPGSVTISNTTTGAGSNYSWTYDSNPLGSNNNQTILNPTSASTLVNFGDRKGIRDTLYTFTHVLTDNKGCKDTATINVNVHPRPTASFTPTTGIDCTPQAVSFNSTSTGQLNSSSYKWTINNKTYSTQNLSHTFTNTGVIDSSYLTKLVVTSGFGCKDSTTGTYTIHPNPKARFSASSTSACAPFRIDSTIVNDSLFTGTNGVYSWYVNGTLVGSSAASTGFPGHTITNTGDSVIIKLVVASKFNCPAKDSMQMVFRTITNPVPNFTMSTSAGCEPLIITLTSTTTPPGVAHLWQVGNQATITSGTNTSNTTLTIRVNNPGTTNWVDSVRLKVTAGTGCSDSIRKGYTVYPKPNAGIASLDSICAAGVLNISHNGATSPTINAYNWSITSNTTPVATIAVPTTTASSTITFPDQQGGSNQSITLRQIVTTTNSCADTAFKTIWMLPRPLANLTRTDSAICAPASVTIANANALTGASYQWSYSSNPAGSTNNQTIVNPTAVSTLVNFGDRRGIRDTLYTFTHIVNDSRGCKDTASINVNVHPRPTAVFGPTTGTDCTPKSVTFTNTSSGQLGASPYQWTINNTTYTSTTPTHIFTNTGVIDSTYNNKLLVTSGFGCKDSTTGTYTIHPNPKARFSASLVTACAPFRIDSLNIFDSLYTGTNGIYSWYVNDTLVGTPSATLTGFPGYTIGSPNKSITIKLVVSSKFTCSAKDSMQMVFNTSPNPIPGFMVSKQNFCGPDSISIRDSSQFAGNIIWSAFPNTPIIQVSAPGSSTQPIINFPKNTTTDTIQYRLKQLVVSGIGCSDSTSKVFIIYPSPKAGILSVDSICAAGIVNISHNGSTPPNINTYNWSITNNTTPVSTIAAPSIGATSITFPDQQGGSNQSITLRQIVTTTNSCADTAIKTIWMLPRPLANLTTTDTAICAPASVTIANANPLSGAAYQWSYSSTPTGSTNNQTIVNPTLASTLVRFGDRQGNNDTIYTFNHFINDARGCKDTATINVNVFPRPIANYTPIGGAYCQPQTINFNNSSTGQTPLTYQWNIHGTTYSSINPTHTFTNIGVIDSIYNHQLTVVSRNNCRDSISRQLTIHPDPKAFLTASNTIACAPFKIDSINIRQTLYPGANGIYEWYVNDTLKSSSTSITGFPGFTIGRADDSVTIKLIARSKFGCPKVDSMVMKFKTIPNPVPSFYALDSAGCHPFPVTFVNTSDTSKGSLKYRWEFGDGTIDTVRKDPTHTYTNTTINEIFYWVKLVAITGATGCSDSTYRAIEVDPLPRPRFVFTNADICYPNLNSAQNTSLFPPNIQRYLWTGSDSILSITSSTSSTNVSISFKDNQTGSFRRDSVTMIAWTDSGCIDSFTAHYRVQTRPIADFSLIPDSSCGPVTAQTVNSSRYGISYQWSVTGGAVISNATASTPTITFPRNNSLVDRIFTVKLVVATDTFGCKDSTTRIMVIHPQPRASFTMDTTNGCAPLRVQFTNTSQLRKTSRWNYGDQSPWDTTTSPVHFFPSPFQQDTTYFITLVIQSEYGCIDSIRDSVVVKPSPVAKIGISSIDTQFCIPPYRPVSIRNTSYGSIDTMIWDFGNGVRRVYTGSQVYANDSITYFQEGTYMVKITAINPCNVSYDSLTITTLEKPKPSFTLNTKKGCSPLLVQFTNTTPSIRTRYVWVYGDGDTSFLPNPPQKLYYADTIRGFDSVYYLTLIAINDCDTSYYYDSVRVRTTPTALFAPIPNSGCAPKMITFYNSSKGDPNVYNWDFGDSTYAVDSFIRINKIHWYNWVAQVTIFNIKLVAKNECGIDSMYQQVLIRPNAIRAAMFVPITNKFNCVPARVPINNFTTGASRFTWNFGDGGTAITTRYPDVVYHTYTRPGIYVISMLASNGCSDTTVYDTVYIYDKPIANFIPKRQQFCAFDSVQFTNTSQNANAYVWYFGDGDSSNLTNPKHQYTRPGGYRVTLVALRNHPNSTVCNDTITDSIFIRPIPIPVAITNIDTNGHCSPFLLRASSNSQFAITHSWNFGDPLSGQNTANGSSVTHLYQNAGLYYLTLYAYNALGCVDSVKYPIKVFETPRPFFVPSNTDSCGPFLVNFNNQTQYNGPGALNYQWFVNGALISSNNQFQYTFTIPPTNTVPLSYVVRLRATSAFGCDSSYFDTITVHPNPKASFTLNLKNGCEPLNITANNTSQASTIYRWYVNGALVSSSNNYSGTLNYSPNAYQIMLIANNQYSCKPDTFMDTVRVYPKPIAAFDKSDSLLCTGAGRITFTNRSTIPQGQYRFIWNFGDGTIDSTSNNPTHFYSSNGLFQVVLTTISDYGCTDADTQIVRIGVPALAMFTADQVRGCDTLTVNFFNQSVNYTGVIWDLGNGTVSNKDTVKAFYSYPNSPYTVTMIALGQFGCNDTLTRTGYIQVFQKPKANFVVDDSVKFVPHRDFYFITRSTPLPLGHLWEFGNYSTDTVYNPKFAAPDTGWIKVKLKVTTPELCEDSIYKLIYLGIHPSALYFPNAFQPDGAFEVSRFNGVGVNLVSYHFKIYNTFGQIMYETTELDSNGSPILEKGWDGTFNGVPMPQDVYYWSAEASFYSPSINTNSINWNGGITIVPNGVPRRDEKRRNKIRKDGTVTLIR